MYVNRGGGANAVSALAHVIAARMDALNLSASDLATQSGVPKQTISNLMLGKTKSTELRTLAALAHALRISLAELIEASGYAVGEPTTDQESYRLARLIRRVPWVEEGLDYMLMLPAEELRTLLRYMEVRLGQAGD